LHYRINKFSQNIYFEDVKNCCLPTNQPYYGWIFVIFKNITEKNMKIIFLYCILLIAFSTRAQYITPEWEEKATSITVDLKAEHGSMRPIYAWFGYDEPNYTYTKNGKKLLSEIARLSPVPVYVRTHNLLTTGDGRAELKWGSTNAYTEDKNGNPVYSWTIIDSIIDTYINFGMKPLMEIGFMPEALSTNPQPYKHTWSVDGQIFTGWTYPPKDYKKWAELVYQWVKHSINRYSLNEVQSWYWELWNEPNIKYWSGTFDEYCKLYDYSADAVKRACPDCIIGGPHTTNPNSATAEKFLRDFLSHCDTGKNYATGKKGAPLDYVGFHAKGNPSLVNGHIRMDMSPQLKAIATGFKVVASFNKFKNLPVIIGECDPEGCAACSMQKQPQNGYRNGTMYSSYTAASYARIYELADHYKINLKGAVTWAFEFEGQHWFDGFRDLATNGADKPVLNIFRMFGLMPSTRLTVTTGNAFTADSIIANGVRSNRSDINGIASRDSHSMAVMIWNYHDDDLASLPAYIELTIKNIPSKKVKLHHYRVDTNHSNSYEAWKKMGSPQEVSTEQFIQLEKAGQLELLSSPTWENIKNDEALIQFPLPRQAVSLITIEW
jgi:xylan 1,4-beta-xylosidase